MYKRQDDRAEKNAERKLYGHHAANLMKTDIKEFDDKYEVEIDLPGFKKDEVTAELNDGYLTVSAAKGLDQDEQEKRFKKLEKKKETQWRVTQGDKERNVKYDEKSRRIEFLADGTGCNYSDVRKQIVDREWPLNGYEAIFYDYFEPSLIGTLKSKGINVEVKELNSYSVFNNTI